MKFYVNRVLFVTLSSFYGPVPAKVRNLSMCRSKHGPDSDCFWHRATKTKKLADIRRKFHDEVELGVRNSVAPGICESFAKDLSGAYTGPDSVNPVNLDPTSSSLHVRSSDRTLQNFGTELSDWWRKRFNG